MKCSFFIMKFISLLSKRMGFKTPIFANVIEVIRLSKSVIIALFLANRIS